MKTEWVEITEYGPEPMYYVWVNTAKSNHEPHWALTEPPREFGSMEQAMKALKDYCHDYEYRVIRSEYRFRPKQREKKPVFKTGVRQRAYAPRPNRNRSRMW